tara:strand:- start:402 stop:578 length:177 start_codon:yes stop_codon:yes gene_type:complete
MVSFARARTKSWLSKLWPATVEQKNNETDESAKSNKLSHKEQNEYFMELIKNGGVWFS